MNIKENQQYQQTHQKIMYTVMDLLQQKNLKQITVTEICRTVRINRSTFYEHFLDTYDVMEKFEREISKELEEIFNRENAHSQENVFLNFFRHIKENRKFYIIYLEQGLVMSVWRIFETRTQHTPQDVAQAHGINSQVQFEYAMEFRLAGLKALVFHWLKRDCEETPEELYGIFEKLSTFLDRSKEN